MRKQLFLLRWSLGLSPFSFRFWNMKVIFFLLDLKDLLLSHAKIIILIIHTLVCFFLAVSMLLPGDDFSKFMWSPIPVNTDRLPSLGNRWQFISFPTGVITLPNWVAILPTFPSQLVACQLSYRLYLLLLNRLKTNATFIFVYNKGRLFIFTPTKEVMWQRLFDCWLEK